MLARIAHRGPDDLRGCAAGTGPDRFVTGSDSEAAPHVLLDDGPAGLNRLRGMFPSPTLGRSAPLTE